MKKVLIIDKVHSSLIDNLTPEDYTLDYKPKITRSEIIEIIADYHVLVMRSKTTVDSEFITKAKNLELIARAGAGLDLLDLKLLEENKIKIVNAPEGNRDAVGEHTLGMLLCLFHKIIQGNSQIRNGIWDREANRGVELKGKTVAIIGYGNMGSAFAQRLAGFQCEVISYDKYAIAYEDVFAKAVSLETIFEKADILSIHIPLTTESRDMINDDFLCKFKKPIYFLNVSRGEICTTNVLNKALDSGKLKGAILDVLENEKLHQLTKEQQLEYDKLMQRDNVILSPHVAGWTVESYQNISDVLSSKILSFYES